MVPWTMETRVLRPGHGSVWSHIRTLETTGFPLTGQDVGANLNAEQRVVERASPPLAWIEHIKNGKRPPERRPLQEPSTYRSAYV
jgi:hypothetical protein